MTTFVRRQPQLAVAAGGDGGDGRDPPSKRLVMTPQLQKAIDLLQMSGRELIAELQREVEELDRAGK